MSFVEIMCVVGLIAMIAAIAVPNYIRSRDRAARGICLENLRQIETAQQQFIFEKKPDGGTKIKKKDLLPYFKVAEFPTCPGGGDYQMGTPNEKPECSLKQKEDHQL
jgi:type II secretory pathway pseudopilin PulG